MTLEEALAALKAAQQKIDSLGAELKKHTDEKNEAQVATLRKQLDEATAALDAAKADVKRLSDAKDAKVKTDADVVAKIAIIDGARALHGKADAVDLAQSNREIMIAALKARDGEFNADGKSDDYVRARFDLAVEQQKKADKSNADVMRVIGDGGASVTAGGLQNGDDMGRMVRTYDAAVLGHREFMRNAWRGDDVARKAGEAAEKDVMEGRRSGSGLVGQQYDGRDIVEKSIAWVRNFVPRSTLDTFALLSGVRRDSDPATAFFSRQLLHIMVTPYQYVYPPTMYASLFPITYEVPTGARSYAFHQFDQLGAADIVDDYSDDAPNAEIVGKELIGKIYPVRSEFQYSIQDIRSAMMAGVALDALKAKNARTIIERKCDALAAVGDTTRSFKGAANDGNATTKTAGSKGAGGTAWVTLSTGVPNATADEILKDVNTMYMAVLNATDGAIEPDTLILGKGCHGVINTLRLDNFNQTTVGEYLASKLPWLKAILYWPRLNTAGGSSTERALCCARGEEYFRFVVPQEFEMFPPQPTNLAFKTPCHKRWAEPQMIQPKAFVYMDGVTA